MTHDRDEFRDVWGWLLIKEGEEKDPAITVMPQGEQKYRKEQDLEICPSSLYRSKIFFD